ncbi:hypothetical protein BCU36_004240 [Vibrio lentus]|nr:hypothetical protein [Vibrio lentus]
MVAITNIHDSSKHQINTYSKGDKAGDDKVAAVLMDTLARHL